MPESEPRWERIPGETTKDWIVSPEGHRVPLGGDVDKVLVYLNVLEDRAQAAAGLEQENATLREQVAHAEGARQIALDQWDYLIAKAEDAEAAAAGLLRALKVLHKCTRCQGDGSPQCVSCDDYQYCVCKPGKGKYADKCWACKGSGISSETARAVIADAESKGIKED